MVLQPWQYSGFKINHYFVHSIVMPLVWL